MINFPSFENFRMRAVVPGTLACPSDTKISPASFVMTSFGWKKYPGALSPPGLPSVKSTSPLGLNLNT